MPDKKTDHTRYIDIIDDEIKQLEFRIDQLKNRLSEVSGQSMKDTGVNGQTREIAELRAEIKSVTKQVEFVKGVKKDFEIQLAQEQEAEKRKKLENLFVLAVVTGAISENLRMRIEQERIERERAEAEFAELVMETLEEHFEENDYEYITIDDYNDIVNDDYILDIVENDPNRLEREALYEKAEYERMMDRALCFDSTKGIALTFEEKEKLFNAINKEDNGFRMGNRSYKTINKEKFEPFENSDIYKSNEYQNSEIGKEYKKNKKILEEINEEAKELAKITDALNKEFDEGTSSYNKGNGFTKELLERELALQSKIKMASSQLVEFIATKGDGKKGELADLFQGFLLFDAPVERQVGRHTTFVNNNTIRMNMEKVKLVRSFPKDGINVMMTNKDHLMKNLAVDKHQRYEKIARSFGGEVDDFFGMMSNDINDLVEFAYIKPLMNPDSFKKGPDEKELQDIKTKIGRIVLFDVLLNERILGNDSATKFRKILNDNSSKGSRRFQIAADALMDTDEFKEYMKKFMKKGKIRENLIDMLAKDSDKEVAVQIVKNNKLERDLASKAPTLTPGA